MKTVYRILTPILAICIFPIMYFLPIIRAMVSSGLLSALSGSSDGPKTNLLTSLFGIGEYTSINDMVKMAKGDSKTLETIKTIWNGLDESKKDALKAQLTSTKFLVAALVFMGIMLLTALAITVLSATMKKHTVPLILSGCGMISALAMNGCFNKFAKPFIAGAVDLSDFLGTSNATVSALLGKVVSIDYLQMSIAYTAALFVFIIIAIFTVCVIIDNATTSKNG